MKILIISSMPIWVIFQDSVTYLDNTVLTHCQNDGMGLQMN